MFEISANDPYLKHKSSKEENPVLPWNALNTGK
jgi:hypothetical protein